jgi:hypothetical protein
MKHINSGLNLSEKIASTDSIDQKAKEFDFSVKRTATTEDAKENNASSNHSIRARSTSPPLASPSSLEKRNSDVQKAKLMFQKKLNIAQNMVISSDTQ